MQVKDQEDQTVALVAKIDKQIAEFHAHVAKLIQARVELLRQLFNAKYGNLDGAIVEQYGARYKVCEVVIKPDLSPTERPWVHGFREKQGGNGWSTRPWNLHTNWEVVP